VTVAGQTLTTTVSSGAWSVTASALTDGTHSVVASITDAAGNTGSATQTLTVVDTVAPVVTIAGGATASTNDPTPVITGTTDAADATAVTVTVAGQTLTTTVSSGAWSVTASALIDGTHTVVASITDAAGNTGTATQALTVDTVAPTVTITGGATASTNDPTPVIAGTTDAADATAVTVTVAGQTLTTTVSSGAWRVNPTTLGDATHTVAASVTDPDGNTGTASQALTVDTTAATTGGVTTTTTAPAPRLVAAPIRVAGTDRSETAALLSRLAFPDGADTVYLATSRDYGDALSAGPGAVIDTAPVLLTDIDHLDPGTAAELLRLRPQRIVVIGGTAAVSDAVFSELRSYATMAIVRVAGHDRFETAAAVSRATHPTGSDTVYLATGRDHADALAAGLGASTDDAPVLLTEANLLPRATSEEIRRLRPSRIVIVGGTAAIASGVEAALVANTAVVERVAGRDRYETAAAVNARVVPGTDTVFIVTGTTFGDALGAIPTAARTASGALTVGDGVIDESVAAELRRLEPTTIIVVGGTAAIATSVERQVAAFLGDGTGEGVRGMQITQAEVDQALLTG
ncbi:MAG TPA: cell wall-binding repeat-containing protein, partial [Acidimicrobiia bacterium]|nr:cell wall-binding repeat-containing protein [Acidimicrobiia bacterium]